MTQGFSPDVKRPWFLPLNNPAVVAADAAGHMRDDDPVVGILVGDQARAYPWWVLANYHLVNDTLITSDEPGGYLWSESMTTSGEPGYPWYPTAPVVVTLCEACSACSAFVPVPRGDRDPLVFTLVERAEEEYRALGTFTIADLASQSRWHPFTGRAHSGPRSGARLPRLPAFVDHWGNWVRDHPSTSVVLAGEEMRRRPHVLDLPGVLDPEAAHTSLREVRLNRPELIDHRLPAAELVLGVADADSGEAVAVPLAVLRKHGGLLQRDVGGRSRLFTLEGDYRGLVLDGPGSDVTVVGTEPLRLADAGGGEWDHLGRCLSGPRAGERLPLAADGYVSKWGEWSLAHPGAEIAG
ncbi:DUF3179 domain-containing (seleno)protein [Actinomycetes bacterium KLBMP 9759]